MEVVKGALPCLIAKLADLISGEYNLQKGLKEEIKFLQQELESIKGFLEDISLKPPDQLCNQDKIWARNARELSYDIEDIIDKFVVQCKGEKLAKQNNFKTAIDTSLGWLVQPKIRRKMATEIRGIKRRVKEEHTRHCRYKVVDPGEVDKTITVTVDPRLFAQFTDVKELVGINETRDELIKLIMKENGVPMQQRKIVSIVGFGGMGKTTLANAVYEKIRAQFDCCAFVSVSRTLDLKKLFKDILYQLDKKKYDSVTWDEDHQLIRELREFLKDKRYFIVIDDIWDISHWKNINYALPDNDVGYKIITTTRISDVAEQVGGAYKMKPLSLNNSRKLLYKKIFSGQSKDSNGGYGNFPDEELGNVTDKILKKCAGVPLAIITIASLLSRKGRNKMDWYEVYNSLGSGLEKSLDLKNMRKILSFSYIDLPSQLRTCLLYLSMFPEDYEIGKDRLIWMWIAEGFIQCTEQGKCLFQIGESYYNELINRSMIQPVYREHYGMLEHCRVHDMVLDLIRSLSSEENFVTIFSDVDHASQSNTVRRLSLQYGNNADRTTTWATRSIQQEQVRSIVVFQFADDLLSVLPRFRVLRVLDLEGCNLSQCRRLMCIENLVHLRYLGVRNTGITKLPEELGNLRHLQTLDVTESGISCLPSTVAQLTNLKCLRVHWNTRVPNKISKLTSLEELSWLRIDDVSTSIIEELGLLTELRVLRIAFFTEWNDKLAERLRELKKILVISVIIGERSITGLELDAWVAPRPLRRLETRWGCWFSRLPAWLDPSLLLVLSFLSIDVRNLQQKDLETLGTLSALYYLDLRVDHKNLGIHGTFAVGAGLFPCLVNCRLIGFVGPVVFQQGAMPRLRTLYFQLSVSGARKMASSDGGLDLGLGNLLSLQDVWVNMDSDGANNEEIEQAEATLRHAAEIHPNYPLLRI